MEQSKISKKLHIKKGNQVLLLNAIEGFQEFLSPMPNNCIIHTEPKPNMDVVQVFVANTDELETFADSALKSVVPDGKLWFAYQKKSAKSGSDISRDSGWEILHQAGYRGVSLISIDAIWSSMRFRKKV